MDRNSFIYAAALVLSLAPGAVFAQSPAQSGPAALNFDGTLLSPAGLPITQTSVGIKLEILDKNSTCVLYSEIHTVDLSASGGAFSVKIGSGTSPQNKLESTSAFSGKIFYNPGAVSPFSGCSGGVTLSAGDGRALRVSYDIGAGYVVLTPNFMMSSVPYAMVADSIGGKHASDFLQMRSDSNYTLTQANAEGVFSVVNYPKLQSLLNGSSSQFVSSTPSASVGFNSQRIVNLADPATPQDAVTKNYDDTNLGGRALDLTGVGIGVGGGRQLVWDQVLNKWVTSLSGSVGLVSTGAGLVGGPITSAGTIAVDVGLTAGKILQLNGSAQIPAVDGSLLVNVSAGKLQGRAVSATAPSPGQVMGWNATASVWEPQSASGSGISALTGDVMASGSGSVAATIANNAINSAKINNTGIAINRLLMTDPTTGSSITYANCSIGEVLQWSPTGWTCSMVAASAAHIGGNNIASNVTLGTNDGFNLTLLTNAVPRLTIQPAGNVGVGTTVPMGAFSVQGNSGNPAAGGGNDPALIHRVQANNNALDIGVNDSWNAPWIQTRMAAINGTVANFNINPLGGTVQIGSYSSPSNSNELTVFQNGTSNAIVAKGSTGNLIALQDNGGTTFTVFTASGNVGIGTTAPSAKMDVAGHVANSGPNASVATCGTGPTLTGNDARGNVLTGTGTVTSCTINFNSSYVSIPFCVASWSGSASTVGIGLVATTTNLTVNFSSSVPGATFVYQCMQ